MSHSSHLKATHTQSPTYRKHIKHKYCIHFMTFRHARQKFAYNYTVEQLNLSFATQWRGHVININKVRNVATPFPITPC